VKRATSERARTKTLTTSNLKLIVGLGNPGTKYTETRHNAGFLVVDELARRWGRTFKKGRNTQVATNSVTLLKPTTFMNRSGQAVQAYQTKLSAKPDEILLVHDDLDLPLGKLRLKSGGGGAGGQRGVKDTIERIGPDFSRLKVGIGRPPQGWTVERWVLSAFEEEELPLVTKVVQAAADAVERVLEQDLTLAMNQVNRLDLREEEKGERRKEKGEET